MESGETIIVNCDCNLDSITQYLSEISQTLNSIENIGQELLDILKTGAVDSIAALLLILVGFETMRLIRAWMKGGHNRNDGYNH